MAKLTAEERKKLHLVLRKVRIAYPEVFEPKHNDLSGKDEYSVQVRLYENNPEHMKIVEMINAAKEVAANAFWGRDAKAFNARVEKIDNNKGLRHNDEGGFYFLSAKRRPDQQAPRIVGRDRTVELRPEDGKIYSGAVCNVVVDLWCYSGKAKNGTPIQPGFSFTLCGIQFVEDGDPIGGASVATDDDFDELEADDDPDFTDIP